MAIAIDRIDHIVLTVHDIERTLDFYGRVLGMEPVTFAGGRRGLAFGRQKLNLHQAGREFEPKALKPGPGAIDLALMRGSWTPRSGCRRDRGSTPTSSAPARRSSPPGPG